MLYLIFVENLSTATIIASTKYQKCDFLEVTVMSKIFRKNIKFCFTCGEWNQNILTMIKGYVNQKMWCDTKQNSTLCFQIFTLYF